jgi:hypothetical protein
MGFWWDSRRRKKPGGPKSILGPSASSFSWQPCAPGSSDRVSRSSGRSCRAADLCGGECPGGLAPKQAMREAAVSKIREKALRSSRSGWKKESFEILKKIGAAAARILWSPSRTSLFLLKASVPIGSSFLKEPLEEEKLLEGKYLILTEEKHLLCG